MKLQKLNGHLMILFFAIDVKYVLWTYVRVTIFKKIKNRTKVILVDNIFKFQINIFCSFFLSIFNIIPKIINLVLYMYSSYLFPFLTVTKCILNF